MKARIRLEALRRDKIVLTDEQILDGTFLLKWLAEENGPCKQLNKKLALRFRGKDTWDSLWRIITENNKPQKLTLCSLGKELTEQIEDITKNSDLPIRSDPEAESRVRSYFSEIKARLTFLKKENLEPINELLDLWEAFHKKAPLNPNLAFEDPRPAPFADVEGSFEDPGGFLHELLTNSDRAALQEELALSVFRSPHKRRTTKVHLDRLRDEHKDPLPTKDYRDVIDWFVRAYHRSIARQHGATVLETVNVGNHQTPAYIDLPSKRLRELSDEELNNDPKYKLDCPSYEWLSALSPEKFRAELARSTDWIEAQWVGTGETWERGGDGSASGASERPPEEEDEGVLNRGARAYRLLQEKIFVYRQDADKYKVVGTISPCHIDQQFDLQQRLCGLIEYVYPIGKTTAEDTLGGRKHTIP